MGFHSACAAVGGYGAPPHRDVLEGYPPAVWLRAAVQPTHRQGDTIAELIKLREIVIRQFLKLLSPEMGHDVIHLQGTIVHFWVRFG